MVYVPKGPSRYQSKKPANKILMSKKDLASGANDLDRKIRDYQVKIQKKSILKSALIPANTINCLEIDIDEQLEKQILKYGYTTPILIITNKINDVIELDYLDFGLKELVIGKKNGLLIPTVVIDTHNHFKDSYVIDKNEISSFIKSKEDINTLNIILKDLKPPKEHKIESTVKKPKIEQPVKKEIPKPVNTKTESSVTPANPSFQDLKPKTRLQYAKKQC